MFNDSQESSFNYLGKTLSPSSSILKLDFVKNYNKQFAETKVSDKLKKKLALDLKQLKWEP